MGPKRCEDAQLLLGMVDSVKAPEGGDAMISPVCQPVGAVHGDQGQGHSIYFRSRLPALLSNGPLTTTTQVRAQISR
jgi:hypothetical protein